MTGEYVNNDKCCPENYYWNGSTCFSVYDNNLEFCVKVSDVTASSTCVECLNNTDFYISDGHCCYLGYYWNTSLKICTKLTSVFLDNCNKVADGFTTGDGCTECTNNTFYIHHSHCCPLKQYWNTTDNQCKAVDITNCDQYNEYDVCGDCDSTVTDNYKSNFHCCLKTNYHDGTTCTAIDTTARGNCKEVDNNICTCENRWEFK